MYCLFLILLNHIIIIYTHSITNVQFVVSCVSLNSPVSMVTGNKVKVTSKVTSDVTDSAVAAGTGPGHLGGLLVVFTIVLTYYLAMACSKVSYSNFLFPVAQFL